MEHLFTAWGVIRPRLAKAGHILLLSDYDGTLTPIVERPEDADLPKETCLLLRELGHQHRYTFGIISGRAIGDLKERVGLEDVVYAGNHGLEIEGPNLRFVHAAAKELAKNLPPLCHSLKQSLETMAGVLVEDKGLTLSVHFRTTPPDQVPQLIRKVEEIVSIPRSTGLVRVTGGKKVFEIRPAVDWNKGKAIEAVLANDKHTDPEHSPLVIFMGDDLTDEDGFAAAKQAGGIGVLIAEQPQPSVAHYMLKSPLEVQEFLRRLVEFEKEQPQKG